jgi:hypothetical protein
MANNINKVWELMGINPETGTGTYKNRMGLGNAITRDNGIPLDLSSLHATYNDAVVYAATSAIAYVDQVIAAEGVVYIITAESQGKVTIDTYKDSITGKIIEGEAKEYDIYIKPVGTIPGFDEADNGTLPQIQIGENGKRTLTWVPISAIVEGDGNTVTEVKAATDDAHVTVTSAYNQANDTRTYTVSVNVDDKADATQVAEDIASAKGEVEGEIATAVETLESAIADAKAEVEDKVIAETEAREAADNALTQAIANALAEAKQYADDHDADTLYNDTEVRGLISEVDSKVTTLSDTIADEVSRATAAEEALGKRIDSIDFINAAELATELEPYAKTEAVNTALADKADKSALEALAATVDAFLVGDGTEAALDSLKELIAYIDEHDGADLTEMIATIQGIENKLVGIDSTVAAHVTATIEALKIGDYAKATDLATLAGRVDTLEAMPFDTYATKSEVETVDAKFADYTTTEALTSQLATKANTEDVASTVAGIEAAIAEKANAEETATALAAKVNVEAYETDKATFAIAETVAGQFNNVSERISGIEEDVTANTQAITNLEAAAETYATKTELGTVEDKADSNASLITNLTGRLDGIVAQGGEPNTINTIKVNGVAQTITSDKAVDIAVPVIADTKISQLNDGQAVLTRISTAETNISTLDSAIGDAQTSIASLISQVSALETEVNTNVDARLDSIEGTQTTLVSGVATNTQAIADLKTEDTRLAALIQANTDKFASYQTKADAETQNTELRNAIQNIDLSSRVAVSDFETYKTTQADLIATLAVKSEVAATIEAIESEIANKANTADVYSKTDADATFVKDADFNSKVDARVNTLIDGANSEDTITNVTNLIAFVNDNAGDIAQLVTDVANNGKAIAANASDIANNKAAHEKNASDIATITATVAAQKVIESTEVSATTVEGGVELGIKAINVNKLVQTEGDVIILNGGTATA